MGHAVSYCINGGKSFSNVQFKRSPLAWNSIMSWNSANSRKKSEIHCRNAAPSSLLYLVKRIATSTFRVTISDRSTA